MTAGYSGLIVAANPGAIPSIVLRFRPPGQKGEEPEVLADNFQDPIGLAVDSNEKLVYVADLGGRIWVVPGPGHPGVDTHIAVDLGYPVTGLNLIQDS